VNCILKYLILFCCLQNPLFTAQIATFYGPIEVDEPVLLELIESSSFQRLKFIHQYGVAYYTTHPEEYTRYEHSLGVFAILRLKKASLEEQIAGLLHDVSHTTFSHVGDWIFGKQSKEKDYQNSIHGLFLERYGLSAILEKYHFSVDQILPLEDLFPMLEKKGPALCADRIEYNIQGAYHQGIITHDEAMQIIADLQFIDGDWVSTNVGLMTKLSHFSLFMTQNCWGSAANYLTSHWLAQAILRGVDLGFITYDDIHFGIDETVWNILINCQDSIIQKLMKMVLFADSYYSFVDASEADMIIKSKFRGIDPLIILDGKKTLLSLIDSAFCEEYNKTKEKMERGWAIRIHEPAYALVRPEGL